MRLGLAIGLLAALPGAAWAFGDCSAPDYLGRFPESPSAASIECVELFRQEVMTAEGPRTIRAIADLNVGWAVPDDLLAAIRAASSGVATALPTFGGLRMDDVTILVLDDYHGDGTPDPEIGEVLGIAGPPVENECLLTVYGLAAAATDPNMTAATTAHEIFHCVQYASFGAALPNTYGSGGDWWVEGSAEYFAGVALDIPAGYTDRGADFDASVAAGRALNEMSYETTTFFNWLHQSQGAPGVRALLEAMPTAPGAEAQQAAMRSALSDQDWLRFVEDYADKAILHPQGDAVFAEPAFERRIEITATGSQAFAAPPFVLVLGRLHYDCGTWGQTRAPDLPWGQRPDGAAGWEDFPEEVDARTDTGRPDWEFAAMATDQSGRAGRLEFERRRSCQPCGETDAVDACVVGTWQQSGGGAEEWMRSQGLPFNAAAAGPQVVTYREDGAYGTEPFGVTASGRHGDTLFEGQGRVTYGFGRWSAAEGQMAICQDAGGMSGSMTVTSPDGQATRNVSSGGAGNLSMSYSCSGNQMSTTLPFPGLPDMVTDYVRISE